MSGTRPSRRQVRQWQYEHGERKLPEAPWWLGNWSAAGLFTRNSRRRRDQLADAERRMRQDSER